MKSLNSIESPKIEERKIAEADTRRISINTYNAAFPLELDEAYVRLTNLIFEYLDTCAKLGDLNNQTNSEALYLNSLYVEDFSSLRIHLQAAIDNLDRSKTSEDFEAIAKIATEAAKMLRKKAPTEEEIAEINQKRFEHEKQIAEEQADLARIMSEITIALQAINSQDIDGEKRIDNLKLTSTHLDAFNNLAISDEEKHALEKQLLSYFNMRCIGFKYVEDLAQKLLAAYNNRVILPPNVSGIYENNCYDEEFEIYRIAIAALTALPDSYRLGAVTSQNCQNVESNCNVLDFISIYLETGEDERELIQNINLNECTPEIQYTARRLLVELMKRNERKRS